MSTFTEEGGPDSPPRPGRLGRKQRRRKVTLIASSVVGVVILVVVVTVAVAVHRLNTPAPVPRTWVAPKALPFTAVATIPSGNLVFDSNRTGNYEIWTMGPTGAGAQQLTSNASYDSWWPQLSPNRQTILFYRTPKGVHDLDFSKTSLWAMAANGTGLTELRPAGLDGWVFQGHAEWSPNGAEIVMFGGSRINPQIWTTNKLGQDPVQITNRGGTNIDPSWSPDGNTITFVGCPNSYCIPVDQEVYTVPATGGTPVRITDDSYADYDPSFSHNGTELAWLTEMSSGPTAAGTWDIRMIAMTHSGNEVAAAKGAAVKLLLPDTSGTINSKPDWSLDDNTIYFHRGYGNLSTGFQIWAVNPNGTDLREVTTGQSGSNEYPSS